MIDRLIRAVLDMRLPAFMEDPKWTPCFVVLGLAINGLINALLLH